MEKNATMAITTTMTNAPKSARTQLAVTITYGPKKEEMRHVTTAILTHTMNALIYARLQLVEITKCTISHLERRNATMARMETIPMNALIPAKSPNVGTGLSRLVKIVMMETMTMMITVSSTVKWQLVGTSSSTRWEARNVTMVMRLTLTVARINVNKQPAWMDTSRMGRNAMTETTTIKTTAQMNAKRLSVTMGSFGTLEMEMNNAKTIPPI